MSGEVPALRVVPDSLEAVIRRGRRCPMDCLMVKTLDQRMAERRRQIQDILEGRGLTAEELMVADDEELDEELLLMRDILRDWNYIDNLR